MKNARSAVASTPLVVGRRKSGLIADYVALTKPRLNLLVVATSAAGYYLGANGSPALVPMTQAVLGTALVAASAAVLNQVYERDTDALMRRTRTRPLPDGRLGPADARTFGMALAAAGLGALAFTHVLAALLAVATLVVYLLVYTPMKRRSSMATLVGAIPGALPPLIGWAAAHGTTSLGAWSLFAIVFLWQVPHFMAIAWMYRDDFGKAGFPMLPVVDPDGYRAGRQALVFSVALAAFGTVPALVGVAGWAYFWIALVLGLAMTALAARFAAKRSDPSARALFYGSIVYLPLIFVSMILDHIDR